uniref:Uncharacterized protein n=1 Tax=Arundo donax TaxID=35708 RepID=A0A0A8Z524_ARUDO
MLRRGLVRRLANHCSRLVSYTT